MELKESENKRNEECLFCDIDEERIVQENELAYVIRDGYPVTEMHSLIIPKRHVRTYLDLASTELEACHLLLIDTRMDIQARDEDISGFNIVLVH